MQKEEFDITGSPGPLKRFIGFRSKMDAKFKPLDDREIAASFKTRLEKLNP